MATKKTTDEKDTKKKTTKKEQKKNKIRKVGALWLRSAKNTGNKYMSGVVDLDGNNSIRVVVFKNGYKEEQKHPDYIIYVQESDDAEQQHDDGIPF
jgi:hypothetical protein